MPQDCKQKISFIDNCSGNVAMMFGLALIPVVLGVGAAVDYTRASSARAQLQVALDAAALAGAGASPSTSGNIAATAERVFRSYILAGPATIAVSQPTANQVQVNGTVQVATSIMRLSGINSVTVSALSASRAFSAGAIEVALALDNTGSMVNDMPALKQAATNLTNALFTSAAGNPNFRMSVVPFVAAVNPGRAALEANGGEALDLTAQSRIHGKEFEWRAAAWKAGCVYNYSGGQIDPGTGGTGASLPGEWSRAARFAFSIFGVSAAFAAAPYTPVTPNTIAPLSGGNTGPGGEFVPTGFFALPPSASSGWCTYLYNPDTVSAFDLYARIPTTTASGALWGGWKGCVLARSNVSDGAAADYDVTDAAPSVADPDSRFVPYFAPDETDPMVDGSWSVSFNNNWLPDGPLVGGVVADDPTKTGHWQMAKDTWVRQYNLLKYDGVNRGDISEVAPNTRGPNRACPDEVLPLTSDRQTVLNKIAALNYWNGAGTIISEGVMWAWRTLSPNKPYATAVAYSPNSQKVLVLMSDGKNELAENGRSSSNNLDASPIVSDFTSYGYVRGGRFPAETFPSALGYLNTRLQAACANAKAKGIAIYTVLFRETSAEAVDQMRQCASQPAYAFTAANGADLSAAFGTIGSQISRLRLVR